MSTDEPKIHFDVPPAEDFQSTVTLIRSTGARGDGGRHFVIDGPTMTTTQVVALLELFRYQSRWDEGHRFDVEFEPPVDPYGDVQFNADRWWAEQLSSGPTPPYRGVP